MNGQFFKEGRSRRIGIFDSGVGGLSVWREVERCLPSSPTVYFADQAHMPYGSRETEEIRGLSENIVAKLIDYGADVIVVACNSASAVALGSLRSSFSEIAFVGMEPAVKPAVALSRSQTILVLATPVTLSGKLFKDTVDKYGRNSQVIAQPCPGLVERVEVGDLFSEQTLALLRSFIEPGLSCGADVVVIGCTHYAFLMPAITHLYPSLQIVNPAEAVARQVQRVVMQVCQSSFTERVGGESEQLRDSRNSDSQAKAARHLFITTGHGGSFQGLVQCMLGEICEAEWGRCAL